MNLHVDEGETVGVVGDRLRQERFDAFVLHLPGSRLNSADKMIFDGTDPARLTPKMFRKISGDQIGMIFRIL